MTKHDAAMYHFSEWWRRNVRNGYGFAEVFWRHRRSPFRIWQRELISSVCWAGLIPLSIAFCSLFYPDAVLLALIYPGQIIRMAWRRGAHDPTSWTYALFILLANFPMLQGIVTFGWRSWRKRPVELIEYKRAP